MKSNLFNELTEAQSEAINGGIFDFTVMVKRASVQVDQNAASAIIAGLNFGNTTATLSNTSNNTVTAS
jgi:hypothetical protein